MSKVLVVTFSDNSSWTIPAEVIAGHRASYYVHVEAKNSSRDFDEVNEELFDQEMSEALEDHYELVDWASGNMTWEDVKRHATRLEDSKTANYDNEWVNAEMVIKAP